MIGAGHDVLWAGPRPLWSADRAIGGAPAILRFASDEFMEDLNGLLDTDPGLLTQRIARYETWRTPQGEVETDHVARVPLPAPLRAGRRVTMRNRRGAAAAQIPAKPKELLKLYQPVHQRHYVVCATLACRRPGLPDRKPAGPHEQVAYVIRRMLSGPDGVAVEHAYVKQAGGGMWQRLAGDDPLQLAPGEERLGLFPLRHRDGADLRRTLWGAVIPVGRREDYLAAAISRNAPTLQQGQADALRQTPPPPRGHSVQARMAEFKLDVSEPWKAMIQSALKSASDINADSGSGSSSASRQTRARTANFTYQAQSWLLLADWMAFMDRHLPAVSAAIRAGVVGSLSGKQRDLYQWLDRPLTTGQADALANGFAPVEANPPAYLRSLRDALARIVAPGVADQLDLVETAYRAAAAERDLWPAFHTLLAGIATNGNGGNATASGAFIQLSALADNPAGDAEIDAATAQTAYPRDAATDPTGAALAWFAYVDRLVALTGRALDIGNEADARAIPFAQSLSQTMAQAGGEEGRFLIRFVHLNEDCGPMHPPTLSDPSEAFHLASFFDPDAPARPIRVTLPMDTSPAGLRKHARGTGFVLSNMLCGQVQRAKGLGFIDLVRQVLPWPLHKDIEVGDGGGCKNAGGMDIGMICSLSIPIITLCALILLMIIVTLLDFIFRWLPWFVVCFPVPGLKGKKAGGTP